MKTVLGLKAVILPGTTIRVISKPQAAFRPERLVISPHSFPLSLTRRLWTWPIVTLGNVLGRLHRGLARLLRVDLYAVSKHREYVSMIFAQANAEEVTWDDDEGDNKDRPYILVQTPLNRSARLLAPLGRVSQHLSRLRLRWQQTQLSTLIVNNITISKHSQFVDGPSALSADLFSSSSIETFVNYNTCRAGHEIAIDVHNGNRRECQLEVTFVGMAADSETPSGQPEPWPTYAGEPIFPFPEGYGSDTRACPICTGKHLVSFPEGDGQRVMTCPGCRSITRPS